MTFAEIERHIKAWNERRAMDLRNRATMDHALSHLIGASVGRLFDRKNEMPSLYEAYPGLFGEKSEQDKIDRSVANFKAFAADWNARYKGKDNE